MFCADEFESDSRWQGYRELKDKYKAAEKDFETLLKIAHLIYSLSEEYQVLAWHSVCVYHSVDASLAGSNVSLCKQV